jgi:hypothetical protein
MLKESDMKNNSLTKVIQQAEQLSARERKMLIKHLLDTIEPLDTMQDDASINLKQLRGVGKHLQDGDPQAQIRQLRDEWDDDDS